MLQGQRIATTGRLLTLTRPELHRLVAEHGGQLQRSVQETTTLLLIGQESLPVSNTGRLKANLRKARSLIQQGQAIAILSEDEFLEKLGLQTSRADIHRLYSTAQLEDLLQIPSRRLQSWIRSGLITPAHSHAGIHYFDFAQVASARSLAELTSTGISLSRLKRSLRQLQQWTSARTSESLLGLAIHAEGGKVFVETLDGCLADSSGQLQLRFDGSPEPEMERVATVSLLEVAPSVDWLACGWEHEQLEEWEQAEEAYRRGLDEDSDDAAVAFNLGNVLFAQGRKQEALSCWRLAMTLDNRDAGCCNNVGVALAELGLASEAIEAFRLALAQDPDFNDANYNLADTLDEVGRREEAEAYYRAYLRSESSGERADYARHRLRAFEAC
jgi:tetratricopeptide (TPR) repeat protein